MYLGWTWECDEPSRKQNNIKKIISIIGNLHCWGEFNERFNKHNSVKELEDMISKANHKHKVQSQQIFYIWERLSYYFERPDVAVLFGADATERFKIFLKVLKVVTRKVKSVINSGNTGQFVIQNLSITILIANATHRQRAVWKTRGTVTIVLYRRCRVKTKSWSMETALEVKKDTLQVVQVDMPQGIAN